jgi:hypothetical protein
MGPDPGLPRSRQRSGMVGLLIFALDVCSRVSVGILYVRVRHGMVAYSNCISLVLLF